MKGKIGMAWVAVFLAVAGAVWGGILKVEVPADVEREDVLNPSTETKDRLDALLREEITKNPGAVEFAPVAFTKNGDIISPAVERDPMDGWSDDRLGFEAAGLFLQIPGSWDAAHWHLREVGQPNYNGVYALAEDIFGYPFWTHNIIVEWDDSITVDGYYNCSTATIYLKYWRNWENEHYKTEPNNPDWNDDAAVLTRCMLQAWHHYWQAYWDHFGSMRRAAWIAIHNKLGDDGYELGFNDLYHDDQRDDRPYYKCLDNYNTEELGTRLANWGDANSVIYGDIKHWRYGAANYCWWKVYNRQPNFMYAFNREFYAWLEDAQFLWPPGDYKRYKIFADAADNGTAIEGRQFPEWFLEQPILRPDHWCDDICVLAVDRTTARVLAYRRYINGATGDECEVGHSSPNVRVYTEKKNWQGQIKDYYVIDVNNGGYGEWDYPIHDPNKAVLITASYNLQGGPPISDLRWGIDSDAAYEEDALYGVVVDAIADGGSVTIKKGGVEQATVPVVGKAFRWTPLGAAGPGEYELVYTPPRGGVRAYNPQTVVKDVAGYFSGRSYLSSSALADDDGNGIPDFTEAVLAADFCPQVNMHAVNRLMPQTTDISLNTGYYGRWTGNPLDPWNWIMPGPGETMRDVIESFEFYYDYDFISFGPQDRGIHQHEYWPQQYDKLVEEYDKAHVYYNTFKYGGKPVIQFWFYYPYNCWRNDHEGDWEHINVRISSPDPARAFLDEVVFYFHEKRKTLNRTSPFLEVVEDTHPVVYIGGEPEDPEFDFSHETSGGSYWREGLFRGVAPFTDEFVWFDPRKVIQHNNSEKVWAGNCTQNPNWWWLMFPGLWGRPGTCLLDFAIVKGNGIRGPWHHECWEVYQHSAYPEYESADAGPIAASPAPAADGVALTRDSFAPAPGRGLGFRPSPDAGKYLAPDFGVSLGGDELGAPGADVPPIEGPGLTSPTNFGGDALSPEGASSYLPPATPAAAAEPLRCGPNPVTGAARIAFKLETPCAVRLAVYDLSGRRVATLADGHYGAGEHAVTWRADVPTGVYIYRLEAAGKVASRKLVVAK